MPDSSKNLPIHAIIDDLLATLRSRANAVLVAPPGAGKTTAVAPALLQEPWCAANILLLSPRRLAARAAAERMAEMAGENVGGIIGYATRLDSKRSAKTRIHVLTEGIFRNLIQADPELPGVSAVLFDEVHERSLDSDFGLALALDVQASIRPDLRLLAMSATLDGARFAKLMGDAPVIESEGKSYPVDIRYLGRSTEKRLEEAMAATIRCALHEAEGSLLAFLPGMAEIERTAQRLDSLPPNIVIHKLHGSLSPTEQRAAITAPEAGQRKIVLATSIAETSLTLEGVRIVVDSGLARRPRYDRSAGFTRLTTERASQAAVTQRAGRAGRQGPGVVYRLWEEAATTGLAGFDPPEILETDLAALLLDCMLWGVTDPRELAWIDPPPAAAIEEAQKRLTLLGAIDENGRPTAHGKAIAALPLPPRLAHMLIEASRLGWGKIAAEIAVLLSERGLGGNDADLEVRLRRWRAEKGNRAESARSLAKKWLQLIPSGAVSSSIADGPVDIGACVALAFPDRLARRRDANGTDWISVGGRGFRLDPLSPLAREQWLAVAEISGVAAGAQILAAAAMNETLVETLFGKQIQSVTNLRFDPATGSVQARRSRKLGAITLSEGRDMQATQEETATALVEGIRAHGLSLLPWSEAAQSLRIRTAFARVFDDSLPDLSDEALLASLDEWLPPFIAGKSKLTDISHAMLGGMLDTLLGWEGRKTVDRIAPKTFTSPAGSDHIIDYEAEGGPAVMVRVQALYGLNEHPCIASGKVPLVLSLTSPANRPIQTTQDLPGFWKGSWAAVAREMRGRYPKHPWPDDPAKAQPTLKTSKAASRP